MEEYIPIILSVVGFGSVIVFFLYKFLTNRKIKKNGIQTEAVLTRVDEHTTRDDDGYEHSTYTYYVEYTNEAGQKVEALLNNDPHTKTIGQTLTIRYLPEKPGRAVYINKDSSW